MINRLSLIVELRGQRKTYEEIANVVGVSRQRVHQILKGYKSTPKYIREMTLRRDKRQCLICSNTKNLEVHHINGIKGDNHSDNLVTLCRKCHHRIEKKDRETWKGQPEKVYNPEKRKKSYEKNCIQCLNKFKTSLARQRFCSKKCFGDSVKLPLEEKKKRHAAAMKKLKQKYLADPVMKEKLKKWQKDGAKKWRKKNIDKVREKAREKGKKRYATDTKFRERAKERSRISYHRRNVKKGENAMVSIA